MQAIELVQNKDNFSNNQVFEAVKFLGKDSNAEVYTLQTIPILPQEKMAIGVVENISISLRLFYKMTQEY
jgi:hypothetical protein